MLVLARKVFDGGWSDNRCRRSLSKGTVDAAQSGPVGNRGKCRDAGEACRWSAACHEHGTRVIDLCQNGQSQLGNGGPKRCRQGDGGRVDCHKRRCILTPAPRRCQDQQQESGKNEDGARYGRNSEAGHQLQEAETASAPAWAHRDRNRRRVLGSHHRVHRTFSGHRCSMEMEMRRQRASTL